MVKIYHDNTKKINFIYRCKTLAGNVNIVNDNILEKGSRFIIGEIETFNELKKYKEYFIDTSLDLKIQVIQNILGNEKLSNESKEGTEILKYYYNKYLENKTLTQQDEHEMMLKIRELNKESKKQKIK